jgi:hypothetical protein
MTEPQRSPVRYGLEVVGAGMLAALAAWALVTALGVQLTVGKGTDTSHVGVVDVLAAALLAGLRPGGCSACWPAAESPAGGRPWGPPCCPSR